MSRTQSYTSASSVPYKLFRSGWLLSRLEKGDIPPFHAQFIPTNRCNLSCSFCSCDNRDRSSEMELPEALSLVERLAELGCEAVTITGGGEPLLYPHIGEVVEAFYEAGIRVGLVTNGTLLARQEWLGMLTWCRISCADERVLKPHSLHASIESAPIDWAFSYVLSASPNLVNLREHVMFAEEHGFTHVRVVADLLDPGSVPIGEVSEAVHSELVVWQPRAESEHGAAECHISRLKPLIGPDGRVYPCCGVQYATDPVSLDLTSSMSMGHWSEMPFESFDGSVCSRCYYGEYNRALSAMTETIDHAQFV